MTAFTLKCIAVLTMTVDHIGFVFFPEQIIFRMIGRLSFPIFCMLIAEGFAHTSNFAKYAARLLIFGLISEVPHDLLFYGNFFTPDNQNIMFELFLGVLALKCTEKVMNKKWYFGPAVFLIALMAQILEFSYGAYGILLIVSFYIFRHSRMKTILQSSALTVLTGAYCIANQSIFQAYAVVAILPISIYNGEKGRSFPKYVFYFFYPVHLLVLYGVMRLLH